MTAIEVDIDVEGLASANASLITALDRQMRNAMIRAQNIFALEAQRRAPVDTGALKDGIRREKPTGSLSGGDLVGEVRSRMPYSDYVEEGTRAHVIRAREGMLRFVIGGRVFYRKQVNHPGTRPQPFMQPAADASRDEIARSFREGLRLAIRSQE